MLGASGVRLTVQYLPVYVPNNEERRDATVFARNVRAQMAKTLAQPTRDVTYKDKLACMVKHGFTLKDHQD